MLYDTLKNENIVLINMLLEFILFSFSPISSILAMHCSGNPIVSALLSMNADAHGWLMRLILFKENLEPQHTFRNELHKH